MYSEGTTAGYAHSNEGSTVMHTKFPATGMVLEVVSNEDVISPHFSFTGLKSQCCCLY